MDPGKVKAWATHHAPDLDVIAAIVIWELSRGKEIKIDIFLRGGDEAFPMLNQTSGIVVLDRGRGELDHHFDDYRDKNPETTASIVAKKLGMDQQKSIRRLLRKVQASDLQGESLPFDVGDIIKCMQRLEVSNEKIIELGKRIVRAGLDFSEKNLSRDNWATQELVREFLRNKEFVPPKFEQYIQRLNNPRFERPFDIAEILAVEGEEGKEFILNLLEFVYEDSLNYMKALEEVEKVPQVIVGPEIVRQIKIRGIIREITGEGKVREIEGGKIVKEIVEGKVIIAAISDNPRFKDAARNKRNALITIQRRTNGQTQIFFDTERVTDELVRTITSMVRLEECLIQNRKIPTVTLRNGKIVEVDLRKTGWVEGIEEWYLYWAPQIPGKKKKGARFLLNGSITAPDVPPSKIPLETLKEIVRSAVLFQPLNWARWKAERLVYYAKNKPI